MKKFISAIAAAAALSVSVFGQCASADVYSLQLETAKSAAEEFVSDYYSHMYTDSEIDLYGRAVYEEMADYLTAKLEYQQSISGDVVNFKVYTYTRSVEESEEAFLFSVVSAVTFNYVGADFDSGFTAGNHVMVEKGGECKILDVMIGGGVNDSLLGREKLDINNCYWEREEVNKEAVAEVCDYIDEVMKEEKLQAASAIYNEPEVFSVNAFTSSVTSSQRNSMVAYAVTNTRILIPEENGGVEGQEISPSSAIPGVEYYDFSYIYNPNDPLNENYWNYDCTNFTSHCLMAGGAQMNTSSANKWYFRSINDRSPAWSSVNYFYDFIKNNKGVGPKAAATVYSKNDLSMTSRKLEKCDVGDIVQIDYEGDGRYDHNVIVVGAAKEGGKYWPAVCGRSGSRYRELELDDYYATSGVCLVSCKKAIEDSAKFRILRLTSLT